MIEVGAVSGYNITLGLERPETATQVKSQADIAGMRAAIIRGSRDSALIAQCMRIWEVLGLTGEDFMTVIAYHALRKLEDIWQDRLHQAMIDPHAPVIFGEDLSPDEKP